MTQEEKAKAYDEALERAKECHIDGLSLHQPVKDVIEHIFPELKESEDERIRKGIIRCVKCNMPDNEFRKKYIAWLEKQGKIVDYYEDRLDECACKYFNKGYKHALEKQRENKTADKDEPKFKVGDWVVDNCGYVWKIEGILNQFYILEGVEGGESRPTIEWVDKTFHLWTIEDAKDGDVLTVENRPFIYNGKVNPLSIGGYCGVTTKGLFKIYEEYSGYGTKGWTMFDGDIHPANKEQRELLFKKMHEASYEWDAEKKELNKIEENSFESDRVEKAMHEAGYKWSEEAHQLKKIEQKSAWCPSKKKQLEALKDLLDYNIGVFDYQKFMEANSLYDDLTRK